MKKYTIPLFALLLCLSMPSYAQNGTGYNGEGKRAPLMEKIDTNGDGFISKDEMLEAHKLRIDRMFERHDSDGDGKLSKEEINESKKAIKNRLSKRRQGIE